MPRLKDGIKGTLLYVGILLALCALLAALWVHPARAEEQWAHLPILMYHDVQPDGCLLGDYVVSTSQLESDLRALKAAGYAPVRFSEVLAYVRQSGRLPEKPVLLVFDDGHRSALERVLPLLEQYSVPAVVSVIGARAQGIPDGCDTTENYLTWQELAQLEDSEWVELQSHTAYLHVYRARKGVSKLPCEDGGQYLTMLTQDIQAMHALARQAGVDLLPSFAYPYGYVEALAETALAECGYLATMTSEEHVNLIAPDPESLYRLGRFNRSGLMSTEQLMDWLEHSCTAPAANCG